MTCKGAIENKHQGHCIPDIPFILNITLFAMTTTDGGNENNAWSNYFSVAPRHTIHPEHKNLDFVIHLKSQAKYVDLVFTRNTCRVFLSVI